MEDQSLLFPKLHSLLPALQKQRPPNNIKFEKNEKNFMDYLQDIPDNNLTLSNETKLRPLLREKFH